MDRTIWVGWYGSDDMDHMIRIIRYGSDDMDQTIWVIWYESQDMYPSTPPPVCLEWACWLGAAVVGSPPGLCPLEISLGASFRVLNGSSLNPKRCILKRKGGQNQLPKNWRASCAVLALKMHTCSPQTRSGRHKPWNTESDCTFRA